MDNKKHTVFLSFAQPDQELAQKLSDLFLDIRETVYFAPEALQSTVDLYSRESCRRESE